MVPDEVFPRSHQRRNSDKFLFYFADQGVLGIAAKYADDEPKLVKFMSEALPQRKISNEVFR